MTEEPPRRLPSWRLPSRLLVVTDRHQAAKPLPALVEELLDAGARWIWLRDKDLPDDARRALAMDISARVARHGGTLTVGADLALAADCRAGLHLGTRGEVEAARRRLGPTAPVGVSAHSCDEIRRAAEAGADYATLSPVFASASKPGYGPALGLDGLKVAAEIGLPVMALGGVTALEAAACDGAGAAGVAVMGAVMRGGAGAFRAIRAAIPQERGS